MVQLGGGISTNLALAAGSKKVTVAESNPVAAARAHQIQSRSPSLTGNPLKNDKVRIIPYDGRLYLGGVRNKL